MANGVLRCTNRSTYSRLREVINPFYLALIRLHLENCVQFGASQYKKDSDELERVQQRMVKGAGELGLREETEGVGLVQPGEEMASRELIPPCSYLWRLHQDNKASHFTAPQEERVAIA